MAEPQFVSVGTHLSGSGTSASVTPPPGTAAGLVVVVTMYLDGTELPVTPAAGFALCEGLPVGTPAGSGSHTLYKWWRRCTTTDTDPYVFTWSESRFREVEVSLWDDVVAAGDPWDPGADSAASAVNSATTPPVEITTAGPDRTLIWSGTNWTGGTWTEPAGFTERFASTFGLATEASMGFPTAGATGPIVGTCTSNDKTTAWLGALIGTTTSGESGDLAVTLPALTGAADGDVVAAGVATATLPSLAASLAAAAEVAGSTPATLPALGAAAAGTLRVPGTMDAALPPLAAAVDGDARVDGALAAALPALSADAGAQLVVAGQAQAGLPPLSAAVEAAVAPGGVVVATLPSLTAALSAASDVAELDVPIRVGPPQLGWPAGTPRLAWDVRPPVLGGE